MNILSVTVSALRPLFLCHGHALIESDVGMICLCETERVTSLAQVCRRWRAEEEAQMGQEEADTSRSREAAQPAAKGRRCG